MTTNARERGLERLIPTAPTSAPCDPGVPASRTAALVEGFKSPFGLELLSTVHWVMRHEPVRKLPDVVARTYAWYDRKRQFTPRQIGIAANVLARQGWVAPLAGETQT